MVFNLSDNTSVASVILRQLRHVEIQKDASRFRQNLHKIGMLLGYELSKTLNYKEERVETPMGLADCRTIADQLLVACILRAGLPLHQGLIDCFDQVETGFIASYRRHHKDGTFEIAMEYATFPHIQGKVLVLADAMMATGSSIESALDVLTEDGQPAAVHVVTAIASSQSIDRLARTQPHVHIWTGAIDDELTGRSYIVPGLGDAGDLAYGPKDQD